MHCPIRQRVAAIPRASCDPPRYVHRALQSHHGAALPTAATGDPEPTRWPTQLAAAATSLAAIALAGAVLAAFVPMWPCKLMEHFAVQLAAGGVVVVAAAAALRVARAFDLAAIATLVSVLRIAPDLVSVPRPLPPGGTPLRVLVLNVHTESTGYAAVRQLIADAKPDLIGLVEVSQRWLDELGPAVAGYPGRLERPRPDNFGVALYTRMPLTGAIEMLAIGLPSAVARVMVGGTAVGVLVIHPLPPMTAAALDAQIATLDAVADRVASLATPVVVLGDFNATPWSQPFHRLQARTGLCDSRDGFGLAPSFPAASAVLRIPIDHLLASCEIGVRDRRIERDVGSDHLPVVLDLVIPATPP